MRKVPIVEADPLVAEDLASIVRLVNFDLSARTTEEASAALSWLRRELCPPAVALIIVGRDEQNVRELVSSLILKGTRLILLDSVPVPAWCAHFADRSHCVGLPFSGTDLEQAVRSAAFPSDDDGQHLTQRHD